MGSWTLQLSRILGSGSHTTGKSECEAKPGRGVASCRCHALRVIALPGARGPLPPRPQRAVPVCPHDGQKSLEIRSVELVTRGVPGPEEMAFIVETPGPSKKMRLRDVEVELKGVPERREASSRLAPLFALPRRLSFWLAWLRILEALNSKP